MSISLPLWAYANGQSAGRDDGCGVSQPDSGAVLLDPVPYGKNGSWAITVWIKPGGLVGGGYEYLFSPNQSDPTLPTMVQSNQVWTNV